MKPDQKELNKSSTNSKSKKENAKIDGKYALKDEQLTLSEMEVVTTVFKSYETGLRQATILPKDLLAAMKMLGLNPMEQEIVDLTNNIVKNGLIYFPEFCKVIQKKFREDDEEVFRQNMFKIMCGTEPFPAKFKAKKYKLHEHFITKKSFFHMMSNLPEQVSEEDIEEMFKFADKDCDGKINYIEFQTMINPPKPPQEQKPRLPTVKRVTIKTTEPEALIFKTTEQESVKTVTNICPEPEEVMAAESTEPDSVKTLKTTEPKKESGRHTETTEPNNQKEQE